MLKYFLAAIASAPVVFLVSVILHNAISAVLSVEEPVFFLLAVVVSPLLLLVGLAGTAVVLARRLFERVRPS